MSDEPVERDLPEWLRVVLIFVLTFTLVLQLGALVGVEPNWVDGESGQ